MKIKRLFSNLTRFDFEPCGMGCSQQVLWGCCGCGCCGWRGGGDGDDDYDVYVDGGWRLEIGGWVISSCLPYIGTPCRKLLPAEQV